MEIIEYNEKIYRCVREPDSEHDFGKWQFLYCGEWKNVISYTIRFELNKIKLNEKTKRP